MHETQELVINTGPIIALVAGTGDLQILQIYRHVYVPFEVAQELLVANASRFAATEFMAATWLEKQTTPLDIPPHLLNVLDRGEAAVIQLAHDMGIQTVCIDEVTGRRHARLNDLRVTGSIGILLRAKREGRLFSVRNALARMESHGIWLGDQIKQFALRESGEA